MSDDKYIWRYKLNVDNVGDKLAEENALAEMIRSNLESLLGIIVLTNNGERVKIDGFKFMNSLTRIKEKEYKIYKD